MEAIEMQEITIDYLQVFLGAFLVVGGALISLIVYIWIERKKQVDVQHSTQIIFNETLSGELGELKTQNTRLEDGLSEVSKTMGSLRRWLIQNESQHKEIEKDIVELKVDVRHIKENYKKN